MVKRALTLLSSILFALPLLMPFNIYANATHLVQTDYLSTVSSEWTNSMVFTSYCEGTNASTASCVLSVNITKSPKNYFGTVTIHGYDSSGTKWINYGDVFVSAGTGVYNYNFYQNGIKEISRVEVYSTNLIQPSSTVDLSQIISLLTSINNYEQSSNLHLDAIEDNTLNTITEIRNVISELVISNGYLDTLTKMHDWHFPIESFGFIYPLLYNDRFELVNFGQYETYTFPIFKLTNNTEIYSKFTSKNTIHIVFGTVAEYQYNALLDGFQLSFGDYIVKWSDIKNYKEISRNQYTTVSIPGISEIISFDVIKPSSGISNNTLKLTSKNTYYFMPIYFNEDNFISTEFALQFGLSNQLLDDIHLIANGTTASQSAADSSQSANEQLQTDSNTLFQQENGFKSDMNNAMQNVNTTFRLQDMGTKFVSSAQWVRLQYESLTNNTPFASLITFSLITGLALILLGKVYK